MFLAFSLTAIYQLRSSLDQGEIISWWSRGVSKAIKPTEQTYSGVGVVIGDGKNMAFGDPLMGMALHRSLVDLQNK